MNEDLKYGEDNEFLLRILNSCSCWFLAEPLILCDNGNPSFGYSGLSGNLKGMQEGQRYVIKEARKMNILNSFEYLMARLFSEMKYIRRILMTWNFNRKRRKNAR